MQTRVLIVDDEANIRSTLALCLEAAGCSVHPAAGAREARAALEHATFDLVFLDVRLGQANGLDLLAELQRRWPRIDVAMITAYADVETAVTAMKDGAFDFLSKPLSPAQVRSILERHRERVALMRRVEDLEGQLSETTPALMLETSSPSMQRAIELIRRAAKADTAVLLRGESGTGKTALARLLHDESARAQRRFVTVNCPTLGDELLTSELFGHLRGAFTGAVRDQAGKVEHADGGTLFLDEIGEVPASVQAKLLRFVQDREFEPVGDTRTRRADVRIVAATNRNLEADVEAGRFRLDLLYRLNVIEVVVPALRERREDLSTMARHFVAFAARTMNRPLLPLADAALELLTSYSWPGNVRELKNEMERAVVLAQGQVLDVEDLSERIRGAQSPVPAVGGPFTLGELEREHTLAVLARSPTREDAARILGIDPSTLWRRMKRYESESEA